MKDGGRKITELVRGRGELYVLLRDSETGAGFMRAAGAEGFCFGDGVSAADRKAGDIMRIGEDRSICYVGFAGHMAFACGVKGGRPIDRIDYGKYIAGEEYLYTD